MNCKVFKLIFLFKNIPDSGLASMTSIITITGLRSITGISPSSGSTNGGTLVTITGNGFSPKTTVKIGNSQCNVVSVEVNKLQCFTTSRAEGDYSVIIRFR